MNNKNQVVLGEIRKSQDVSAVFVHRQLFDEMTTALCHLHDITSLNRDILTILTIPHPWCPPSRFNKMLKWS